MDMLRRKLGDYYLVDLIGAGGMSKVYLALNPRTRDKRAVKVLARRAVGSPAAYVRFQREVEIIRRLSHPNIVKILDSGSLEDCYYYSMEYMRAGSLARRLSLARISLPEVLSIFGSICGGMAYAHEKDVIHRDLKPANILIGTAGEPMVSDFGIAKVLEPGAASLTKSGEIMGSLAYLSPEQRFNSKRVDRRTDVFSLGAILYEMVMGFPPLGKFPWPCETQPGFPSAVQAIMEKCLAVNPEDRYDDAGSLVADLRRHVSGCSDIRAETRPSGETQGERGGDHPGSPRGEDRIDNWLRKLRTGTTRERLTVVREMVEKMDAHEAKAVVKLFPTEGDRVRWGLIRVLGELDVPGASALIIRELQNPFQRECAVEALGKIGSEEAFNPIRRFLAENPACALHALIPLARTGKRRSIKYLRNYLNHDMAVLRATASKALACVAAAESLAALKERLRLEKDDRVRASLLDSIRHLEAPLPPSDKGARDTEILSVARLA